MRYLIVAVAIGSWTATPANAAKLSGLDDANL